MRHKLRQCDICGVSFVDRVEKSDTCSECRTNEVRRIPGTSSSLSVIPALQPVILGTGAPQLAASKPTPAPEKHSQSELPKLWQGDSREAASAGKTTWVSPPFKVGFEDNVYENERSEPVPGEQPSRLSRPAMRLRYKLIPAAAVLLFYFIWPVTPLHTPESQLALNERLEVPPRAAPEPTPPPPREQHQPPGVQKR